MSMASNNGEPKRPRPLELPEPAKQRLQKAGIDISQGYPYIPPKPEFIQDVYAIRAEDREYTDAGTRADPQKKALFSAAKAVSVWNSALTKDKRTNGPVGRSSHVPYRDRNCGPAAERSHQPTKGKCNKPKFGRGSTSNMHQDELALLIAERSVVFFRDQDLSPQQQLELGRHFGEVEVNPQDAYIPGLPGTTVVWPEMSLTMRPFNFRNPFGTQNWHTDMVYENQPPGIT
jgi:hypothetical protein